MEEKGRILFKHDDQILAEKVMYQFIIICVIMFFIVVILVNKIASPDIFIPLVISIGVCFFFFYIVELDYAAKKEFAVTENGIIIPINNLYPLYKKRARTTFIPFSEVETIIHSKAPPNTKIKVIGGKEYYMFLNLYELKTFKNILQRFNIENNIRVIV